MTIFQKKKAGQQPQTKMQKRISGLSTPDLVTWSENALFTIGKELTGWLRSNDDLLLDDAEMAAEALLEITRELKRRASNV